jgi:hypothetical protein
MEWIVSQSRREASHRVALSFETPGCSLRGGPGAGAVVPHGEPWSRGAQTVEPANFLLIIGRFGVHQPVELIELAVLTEVTPGGNRLSDSHFRPCRLVHLGS